ncbi:hypothetical protein [Burkholderia sp. Bp8992]|uniref:hypothetical protein n=1 Tax=Burkholderia sp. Bp8992 TaxID=2184554 RepID=UPI000F5751B6|nr:hypothetical protein [Burkholderia sp. Bp8992]
MQARLTDLLKAVKPERALLTTFTLSLSWFEAFCLPILRVEGCEQIDLFVDSREACKLGAETTSAYAGTAFRIVSVHMNKAGFFHPKIAYLQGADDDTLVVGSGNLTQPGQGGNLEVIDAVNASQHPQVFEEFADFAELFARRPGLSPHTVTVLKQYAKRAREVAAKAPASVRNGPRSAWLVHTLTEPAQAQLGGLVARELENPVELTVFSPFHSPSTEAVAKLVKSCGGLRTRFGLIPVWSEEDKAYLNIAPFERGAKHLPKKPAFVTAVTGFTPRRVHAKCFEVKGENACLVMTGSVNATHQSLCETRNVEISLVRKLSQSPFSWKAAKPDDYIPCEFEGERDTGPLGSVEASWSDTKISGVLAPNEKACTVRLEIWSKNRREISIDDVSVDKEGLFEASTRETCQADYARRIKIVEDAAVLAVGWLNVENALAFPPNDRDLSKAANNISTGKPSERDLRTILEHFRRVLRRERTTRPPAPLKVPGASRISVPVPTPTRYDDWTSGEQKQLGVSPRTAKQILAAAFASLRKPVCPDAAPPADPEAKDPAAPGEPNGTIAKPVHAVKMRKPRKRPRPKLPDNPTAEMLKKLPAVLQINASGLWIPSLVAVSLGERLTSAVKSVEADALPKNEGLALLGDTLRKWLVEYARYDYGEANRARLIGLFCGAAACAVFFGGEAVNPPRLKQLLESFRQSPLDSYEWLDLADKALALQPFEALDATTRKHVLDGALTLAETLVTRQVLESLVIATLSVNSSTEPRFPRYQKIHDQLGTLHRNQVRSGKTGRLFGIISAELSPLTMNTRCPACNALLGTRDMVALLSHNGVALHSPGCNKPVFVGLDREKLETAHIPRAFYGYVGPELKE